MTLTNRGIRKALPFLTLIFFLFSLLLVWSFFTLNHSNYFHQLNIRHFKHTAELSGLISAPIKLFPTEEPLNLTRIRQAILDIRTQPIECLEKTLWSDRLLMDLIGTGSIITICENDLRVANETLNALRSYENGTISIQAIQAQLVSAQSKFQYNSIKFEHPVEKTINVIASLTIGLIILSSIIVLLLTILISRAVSTVLTNKEAAMKALALSEERNKQLAYNDSLTGLPNRNSLERTINNAIAKSARRNSQFAVMFIDLDQFKDINDTLGHTVGDTLLVEMAKRIAHAVRETDSVVRFGGDEFVAVTDCFEEIEIIDAIAHRIINTISEPVQLTKIESYITASIGIACYPQNGVNSTALLKHADTAMYQAKNAGKNRYQPYDKLSATKQNRKLDIVNQLHHAIDNNEFSLAYQPVVKLADGSIVSSEALLRWTTKKGETIGPDEFIPIAENSGQIIDIGNWVLQQACQQCKIWHDAGATHHAMAINVSSHQLKDPQFSKRLSDILTRLSLPAALIHIEITENSIITEDKKSVATLHELSELGTRLLLDDFGTGYSCLSYLKDLPFDVLKIDKSFMPANNTIASTIIAMGHELNMEIIAEGIETEMCYKFLKNLKCQYGQGYLFQKPVPASEFDTFKRFNFD
ncbi:putative bifunctional diguanylate cyclase/phosphodiesterase [Neptuniibacter pectenicola]|uniref:putative bifunctional diguanylate cyclase/phosphodiesterase n=1 Tax=Neptuniibacter pectenicola TaxID=1806669 RepID=UPI00082CA539|nr:EAL domain-containing protein [Neptuniibacter pectenicola]